MAQVRQPGEGVTNIGICNEQRGFRATERHDIISSRANDADSRPVEAPAEELDRR